jgi:2-C-methyl-D-erythritol 2,4-cyclodiphosphate synthase
MFLGLGYDVHRFAKKRPLILGGVKVKHPLGLKGHSDADVLIHALMDAILGACGLNDIGHYFPNNDPKYKNISSLGLLKEVKKILQKKKRKIINVDITLIAEKPAIKPYIAQMKSNIAKVLDIKPERIGIKATTNEKMGFIGRGEGIASMAIASVK